MNCEYKYCIFKSNQNEFKEEIEQEEVILKKETEGLKIMVEEYRSVNLNDSNSEAILNDSL
jgi:hypothetical protein